MSDDWTSSLSHNFQRIEANGFNDYDPAVGDLETIKFYDEFRTDEWEQTSLVIEGDLGFAQLTVAGSYYDRETFYQHDTQAYSAYFMYTLGVYGGYSTYDFGADPIGYLTNDQQNTSKTLEVRLTNSTDKLSWTAGMFYMDSDESWDFYSVTDNYADSPAFATWSAYAAYDGVTIEPDAAWWYSSQQTNRVDKAVFGEIDYNLTDRLSLLVGGRWYEIDREIDYKVNRPSGYWGFDYQAAYPGQRQMVDDGFTPKVGLQYDVSDNVMVWTVYSEGYRVGGTNRGRGIPTLPLFYDSDLIENMEFGLKSNWMDDTVQLNATMYQMEWNDMQLEVTDPSFSIGQPWQAVVANLGDGTVRGMDVSLTAVLSDNIQVGVNVTRIFNAYVNPIQTYPDDRFEGGVAPLGLEAKESLPMFAETSYSMYFEYTDQMDLFGTSGDGFVRLQHSYEGTSLNQLSDGSAAPQQEQGNYRLTDIVMGYDMGDWKAQFSLNNLSDERGITYRDSSDYDPFFGRNSDSVVRPRNYNVSLRRYF